MTSPNSRDNMRSGCPECAKGHRVSDRELILYYYVKFYFDDAVSSYSDATNGITEIDIFIPSLNVGIEYDGGMWHQNIKKDMRKDEACCKNNIKLFRVREQKCPIYESTCDFIYLNNKSINTFKNACKEVLCHIGVKSPDIDIARDLSDIESLISRRAIDNSLGKLYPDIALEWNYNRNGSLKPEFIAPKSDKQVWWICSECGHEWMTAVKCRTSKGCGCPECGRIKSDLNRRKISNDFIDELSKINNNIFVTGEYIRARDPIDVVCKVCGYEWSPTPDSLLHGTGCPECGKERSRMTHCKMVYCPELNLTFNSGKEASINTGVSYSNIMACINGGRKSAGKHPITKEKLTWQEIQTREAQ